MNKKLQSIFKQALALFMVLCSVWGWGQATLPVNATFANVTSSGAGTMPTGFSQNGLGGYSGSLKFDTAGDWLQLYFNGSPGTLTFDIGVNNAFPGTIPATAEFTVEESVDGTAWTILGSYTGSAGGTKSLNLNIASRYVRWYYTTKPSGTNIALKNIKLLAPTCTSAGSSFPLSTLAKTTADAPFTNTFTTNNTSQTVYSSSDTGVATVNSSTGEVTIVGPGTAVITVTQVADATYCAVNTSYTLNVVSAAPSLAISGTANHGPVCTGTPASVQTYTVTNTGNSAAGGLTVVSDNSQFVVSNLSATTIPGSNGTVTFDVTFTPTSAGAQNATITVQSSTSGSNVATFDITGTGNTAVNPGVAAGSAVVTNDAATLYGEVTSFGSCLASPIVNRGFVYTVFTSPEINGGTYVNEGTAATGAFSVNISGLVPAKTYYYKAFLVDAAGHYYYSPTEGTFTTSLATPVATAATNVTPVAFTANWNAVNGAESYVLEVYEETGAPMTDLIISEYVEGSSSNKAIEIYNGTSNTVDLSGYTLVQFNNGATRSTGTRYALPLSGLLETGTTYVIVNSNANISLRNYANLSTTSSVLNFNGDDALALYRSSDVSGTTILPDAIEIDIIGKIGDDPGAEWGNDLISTADNTLRRKNTVITGVTVNPITVDLTTQWDGFAIDTFSGLGTHTANTLIQTLISTQHVGDVLSFSVTGLNPDSNYTYTVKAVKGEVQSVASNTIEVTTPGTPTWNGTAWSNTTGPDASTPAIVDGDYAGPAITAQSLTVNAGKTLTVNNYVSAGNVTNNGNIIVNDGANFVQTGTFTAGAESSFKVRKDTKPVKRLAYINWSSPMNGSAQTLKQFSYGKKEDGTNQSATGTVDNRFFSYNNNAFVGVSATSTFNTGAGYLIRTPNDFTTTPQIFQAQFEGTTPNSGTIPYNHSAIGGDFVMLGNPYPSSISISDFLAANAGTTGTVYVWNSEAQMDESGQYTGTNYNTYSATGEVPVGSMNGYMPVGQAFFVERDGITNPFVFNNDMRRSSENGVFSKNATSDRFWLQLSNTAGSSSQMLFGFNDTASKQFDKGYDAALLGSNADAIFTTVDEKNLVIDTHGAFTSDDNFVLNANLSKTGNYTLGVIKTDGLFSNGQQVWLKDLSTGVTTLISEQPYSFNAAAGTIKDRFVLQFKPGGTLATDSALKGNLTLFSSNGEVYVKANQNITGIEIYEMSGKLIAAVKSSQKEVSLRVAFKGVVVAKVTLVDGSVQTKKLMLK